MAAGDSIGRMSEVVARSNQGLVGWPEGETKTVERTGYVDSLLASGRISEVAAVVPASVPNPDAIYPGGGSFPEAPKLEWPAADARVAEVRAYAEQVAGEPLPDMNKTQLWSLINGTRDA